MMEIRLSPQSELRGMVCPGWMAGHQYKKKDQEKVGLCGKVYGDGVNLYTTPMFFLCNIGALLGSKLDSILASAWGR